MSALHTEYKIDVGSVFGRARTAPSIASAASAFLDFRGLAGRLGIGEQWVRRNVRRTYTRDPIPHLRLGRIIRFVWDSPEMQGWIERRKTAADGTKTPTADVRFASYNLKSTGHDETKRRKE
jgi:hypothetical protein